MAFSRHELIVSLSVVLLALAGFVLWSTGSTPEPDVVPVSRGAQPTDGAPALRGGATRDGGDPSVAVLQASVLVRDLADGSHVASVELTQEADSGAAVALQADENGRVTLPAGADAQAATYTIATAGWRLANARPEPHEGAMVLWAWRRLVVHGRIEYESGSQPPSPRDVQVEARYGGPSDDGGARGAAPWNDIWARARGLSRMPAPRGVSRDGSFKLVIPRMDGFGLRASAPGFETAYEMLAVDSTSDVLHVVLRLRPCLHVRGVARSEDGTPIANAEVRAYVVRRQDASTVAYSHTRVEFEGGYTASIPEGSDVGWVTTVQQVRTDAEGRFALPLRTRGEVWIVAYGKGRTPTDRSLGLITQDVQDVDITLSRSPEPPTVRLVYGDRVIEGGRFVVADMTVPELQAGHILRTNAAGDADPTWLRRGRRYAIIHDSRTGGGPLPKTSFFEWSGQRVIDLARLPTEP